MRGAPPLAVETYGGPFGLVIFPQIKLFSWRACAGILPTALLLSSRIPNFSMACAVCGHPEKSTTHVILDCPLALSIWTDCGLDAELWESRYPTPMDCIDGARVKLNKDKFREFLAVMWECWNVHNRFIFKRPECDLHVLSKRAIAFVHSFREHCELDRAASLPHHPSSWAPPVTGISKLNFDAGRIGDSCWGWGFMLRNQDGDILLVGGQTWYESDQCRN